MRDLTAASAKYHCLGLLFTALQLSKGRGEDLGALGPIGRFRGAAAPHGGQARVHLLRWALACLLCFS